MTTMYSTQLISEEALQKADKVLFIGHLAIGDYTYLQNYFRAFAQRYPHIKIDIFVDELRRTRCFWRWKYLKKYALYDWLDACPFIHRTYRTYSAKAFDEAVVLARAENYPIVVSLATLRSHRYARLARNISPHGLIVGLRHPTKFFHLWRLFDYQKFDQSLLLVKDRCNHITEQYAHWFKALCGVEVAEKLPFVTIPNKWIVFAKLRFLKWGIDKRSKRFGSVVFINPFAKNKKRCWPLERVADLIRAIKQCDELGDVSFVINVIPEEKRTVKKYFDRLSFNNTFLCCADHNFFQLPSIMSLCDVVISVETSTMHLANAVHVPVVALMRKKNPEWASLDGDHSVIVTTRQRHDWVRNITVDMVMQAWKTMPHAEQKYFQAKSSS